MKISKSIAWMVLLVLTCVGFAACSDDDDEPNAENSIIGTWLMEDDMEPELFTFKKDNTFEDKYWLVSDPEDVSIDYGTYKYDEKNGLLQLVFDEHDIDFLNVEIKGDIMYWSERDSNQPDSEKTVLYRQK